MNSGVPPFSADFVICVSKGRDPWRMRSGGAAEAGEWMKVCLCLLYIFPLSLSLSLLAAASLWLLPPAPGVCMCARARVHTATGIHISSSKTKGAGLLFLNYQPCEANKGPIFIEKSIFISAPFDYQREQNTAASFLSFNSTEKLSLLLSFRDWHQNGLLGVNQRGKLLPPFFCLILERKIAVPRTERCWKKRESPSVLLSWMGFFYGVYLTHKSDFTYKEIFFL